MSAIYMQETSARGRTGIGTVIVRGEEVWRDLRQQADLAKASFVPVEEDTIGSEKLAGCLNLQMWVKKRIEWWTGGLKAELGLPELPEPPSGRSTWSPS
jgi:hypothetical protein